MPHYASDSASMSDRPLVINRPSGLGSEALPALDRLDVQLASRSAVTTAYHRAPSPARSRSPPAIPTPLSLPSIHSSSHGRKMTTPIGVPEDLSLLLVQPDEARPKGRRHRRDERSTYGSYPAVVNQSFAFQQPPSRPQSSAQVYHRPRSVQPPYIASRPPSTHTPFPAATRSQPQAAPAPTPTLAPTPQPRPAVNETPRALPEPQLVVADDSAEWAAGLERSLAVVQTGVQILPAQAVSAPVPAVTKDQAQSKVSTAVNTKATQQAATHHDLDDYEDDISCAICMNVMVGPCVLSPCGHTLCGPCIVPWLETRASTGEQINCPVCRERVSKRHPLVQCRALEAVIKRWVEQKTANEPWDGYEDWKERQETWKIHRQYTPSLVSPELFNRHPSTQDIPVTVVSAPSDRLERIIVAPQDLFGSFPSRQSSLLDSFFRSQDGLLRSRTRPLCRAGPFDPFTQLSEMSSRFDAVRNSILQDLLRSRQ